MFENHLAEYVDAKEHRDHAHFARKVAEYHDFKAQAMDFRMVGNIPLAQIFEEKCDKLAEWMERQN